MWRDEMCDEMISYFYFSIDSFISQNNVECFPSLEYLASRIKRIHFLLRVCVPRQNSPVRKPGFPLKSMPLRQAPFYNVFFKTGQIVIINLFSRIRSPTRSPETAEVPVRATSPRSSERSSKGSHHKESPKEKKVIRKPSHPPPTPIYKRPPEVENIYDTVTGEERREVSISRQRRSMKYFLLMKYSC